MLYTEAQSVDLPHVCLSATAVKHILLSVSFLLLLNPQTGPFGRNGEEKGMALKQEKNSSTTANAIQAISQQYCSCFLKLYLLTENVVHDLIHFTWDISNPSAVYSFCFPYMK